MSAYYEINRLKIRIADHEPNFSMDKLRGRNDIELYVKSADNQLLSIVSQLEQICNKKGLDILDFQEIINDWQDGSYDKVVFSKKDIVEGDNFSTGKSATEATKPYVDKRDVVLANYSLSRFAKHAEVKALSEKTEISQSYIKKYFGIR